MTQPPYGDVPLPTSGQPYPTSGQPYLTAGQGYPVAGQGYPTAEQPHVTFGPPSGPPSGPPDDQPPPAEAPTPPAGARRRTLIAAAVVAVLLLCAGGGVSAWLLLRNLESGDGAPEPAAAVDAFLTAVYADKDTGEAAALVCSEARDSAALAEKVAEVRAYDAKYESPRFEWDDPKVDDRDEERAVVSVRLRMITADERTAEQQLTFTVVRKTGWWVCEVA